MAQSGAPDSGKTLTGKVLDSSSQTGIAGARVELEGGKESIQTDTLTGPDGGFHFDLPSYGHYRVSAKKDGYAASLGEDSQQIEFAEGKGAPAPVVLALDPSGTIRGTVVGESDDHPLADLRVDPYRCVYLRGRREPIPEGWSRRAKVKVTAGNFELSGLPPGEYFLEIKHGGGNPKPGESFADTTRMLWPEGDFEYTPGLRLTAGGDLDVGKIRLRKSPLTIVGIEIDPAACEEGRQFTVEVNERTGRTSWLRARSRVSCPKASLQLKLSPGKYQVSAIEEDHGSPRAGVAIVEVGERDTQLELLPQSQLTVSGRVTLAETGNEDAFRTLAKKLQIKLWSGPADGPSEISVLPSAEPASLEPGGAFTTSSYPTMSGGKTEVETWGLPGSYYVKEVVYNGASVPGRRFELNAAAPEHTLKVVLSDQGAAFRGQVRDRNDKPVAQSKVLLVPWPANPATGYPADVYEVTTDASGTFSFTGLRPQDYRAIAVRSSERARLEEPGRLVGVLAAATSVSLQQGQSLSLDQTLAEE